MTDPTLEQKVAELEARLGVTRERVAKPNPIEYRKQDGRIISINGNNQGSIEMAEKLGWSEYKKPGPKAKPEE
jgi:hypothetical protein